MEILKEDFFFLPVVVVVVLIKQSVLHWLECS